MVVCASPSAQAETPAGHPSPRTARCSRMDSPRPWEPASEAQDHGTSGGCRRAARGQLSGRHGHGQGVARCRYRPMQQPQQPPVSERLPVDEPSPGTLGQQLRGPDHPNHLRDGRLADYAGLVRRTSCPHDWRRVRLVPTADVQQIIINTDDWPNHYLKAIWEPLGDHTPCARADDLRVNHSCARRLHPI
jgi:hypothetical protein